MTPGLKPALRFLSAVLSGVLFAAAFPDIGIGWLAFIAFVPLLVVIPGVRARDALLLGWVSQTTAWLLMVPWVVRVMSYYGGLPWLTGVLIFIAMAVMLGLYGALFAWIVHRLNLAASFGRWLLVPLAWAAIEYAKTYLITGFPWNLLAAAIVDYTPLIQIDRFAGPYFVAFLVVLPATLIAWMIRQRPPFMHAVMVSSGVAIVLFVWWGTGLLAAKVLPRPASPARIRAALLQPDITQQMRWDAAQAIAIYQRMMSMTAEAVEGGARVVIWPESTVPLAFAATPFFQQTIEAVSHARNIDVILGSVAEDEGDRDRIWNAAFLVSGGRTIGHYDKMHLVPFGEYVPLRRMLFFAEKLVRSVGEFQFGTNDRPLRGQVSYGPAICYEIVFPQIARAQVRHGAEVLVTITNDAWYDGTSAPRQHLQQARLRAIETDRYLLRAATTGISAVIDPAGRILKEIPMPQAGIIYADVEPRHSQTPYVKYGDWFAWVALGGLLFILRSDSKKKVIKLN